MSPNHKLDIFDVLKRINTKDTDYFSSLSEDEQKSIQPLVLMRWMTGGNSPQQIMMLNEFVNPYVFSLSNDKKLLFDLLTACSPGRSVRAKWIKRKKQSSSKTPLSLGIVKEIFQYSTKEALLSLDLIDNDTILMYAIELGRQSDDIKKLKAELRKR